jgi:hypothetical protein
MTDQRIHPRTVLLPRATLMFMMAATFDVISR